MKRFTAETFLLPFALLAAVFSAPAHGSINRSFDDVVLTGDGFPSFMGAPVDSLYVLAWNGATWSAVPFQIDEKQVITLLTCLGDSIYGNIDIETTYVYSGPEGNGLDDNDELVFLGRHGGLDAAAAPWPAGTDTVRYHIELTDPVLGGTTHAYLFRATTPPVPPSSIDLVSYSYTPIDTLREETTVLGESYSLHYGARWRLDSLRILSAGGGDGTNLIDRMKFREATNLPDATGGETEETWDLFSCLLGCKDGPVRAIREIQGAASGVNTTYIAFFLPEHFKVRTNLRVHPVPNIVSFVDYHSAAAPLIWYNPYNRSGIIIDGVADTHRNPALAPWEIVSHPSHGALFIYRDEPIPLPAASRSSFWWDDATFVDATGDDEPGRYGSPGIVFENVSDTDTPGNEARIEMTLLALPAGTGEIGDSLAWLLASPITAKITVEKGASPTGVASPPTSSTRSSWSVTAEPNPFNPSIRFHVEGETIGSAGTIRIFDAAGRNVRTFAFSNHSASWNGDDDNGRELPSGTYFYRVDSGVDVRTGRIVLLR